MEHGIDLQLALDTLKKQIADEKAKLDYILKGAELLAQMLATAAKQNETARQDIKRGESRLEEEGSPVERNTI